MRTKYSAALNDLVEMLVGMNRSAMEEGEADWLHDISCLEKFSDNAIDTVDSEIREQWFTGLIRCRPSQFALLRMLEAAQQTEAALTVITQMSHNHEGRPAG